MTGERQRFLCDKTLQRFARWLRAAGYDTLITNQNHADYSLLRQAIDDDRLLLTRDKQLNQHRRAQGHLILLTARTLHECARELTQRLKLDWQHRPFSRCLTCNTPLLTASQQQLTGSAKKVHAMHDTGYFCPSCRQVFWETGHNKRMRSQLCHWQEDFTQEDDVEQEIPRLRTVHSQARKS